MAVPLHESFKNLIKVIRLANFVHFSFQAETACSQNICSSLILTEYLGLFRWISYSVVLSFLTRFSLAVWLSDLTYPIIDSLLTWPMVSNVCVLLSFYVDVSLAMFDNPQLWWHKTCFRYVRQKSVLAVLQYSTFLFQNFLCFLALIIQPTAAYALM